MNTLIYYLDQFWRDTEHERVKEYPVFSGGPVPMLTIVAIYLYTIIYLGPRLMKNREPFQIIWTVRIYNILMSLTCGYNFFRYLIETNYGTIYFGCQNSVSQATERELVRLGYHYCVLKLIEFSDTIFFVLRKKYNQASFLHLFHHSFIFSVGWLYFKLSPDATTVLFSFINSGIHMIMYMYYFLATFKSVQSALWWKPYLTMLQISQFVISMIHFGYQGIFSSCNYPRSLFYIGFSFNFIFFLLFIHFYHVAYVKSKKFGKDQAIKSSHKKN